MKKIIPVLLFVILSTLATATTIIASDSVSGLYFAVGKHYFSQSDFESARAYFEKSVAEDGSFSEAFYNLGVSNYKLGDMDAAISNFNRATKIDENYARAYYSLGLLYFGQGDFDNAIINFEKAVSLDGSENMHFDLAASYVAKFRQKEDIRQVTSGDLSYLEKAISHFEKATSVANSISNANIVRNVVEDYGS